MTEFITIISPKALKSALGQGLSVKLIDCRFRLSDPEYGASAYAQGHLPDAVFGSIDETFANPPGNDGRHPLPDRDSLLRWFSSRGIGDGDQIICYDDQGGGFAARVWWCARWLGHENIAVLDGGLDGWPDPLVSGAGASVTASTFTLRHPISLTVDAAFILNEVEKSVIDARSRERFDGVVEPIDAVAGHIPGAVCLPFQDNLDDQGRFLKAAQLRKRFNEVAGNDQLVVCYCGSGITAAHNVLAMNIAGLPEPRLYPGSWSEWIQDQSRPIATTS